VPAAVLEYAFECGVNYIYWGSFRRKAFAEGVRNLRHHREQMNLVVQSYSPFGSYLGHSVEGALRALRFDYAEVLLLGLWNRPVSDRVLDCARGLEDRGPVRLVGLSTHNRRLVPQLAPQEDLDLFHVRYNAVYVGEERDVFRHLPQDRPPGIVVFTATSWG
jgi:predicted aldo/keto reductase-like oxidoreductase